MQKNLYVEISATGETSSWIRLSGKAVFSNNIEIKKMVLDTYEMNKSIYKTPDNPVFEIFYLQNAEAVICDFSGNPPSIFKFY